jgi:hypothetical protein
MPLAENFIVVTLIPKAGLVTEADLNYMQQQFH